MKTQCPLCGNTLATEDLNLYTCINCDEMFTAEELSEEYGIDMGSASCNSHGSNQ
jgi:hypothetical protein